MVRFVISSPEKGAVTFNLAGADAPRLDQALNQVKTNFGCLAPSSSRGSL
jgi:hypothetical protein